MFCVTIENMNAKFSLLFCSGSSRTSYSQIKLKRFENQRAADENAFQKMWQFFSNPRNKILLNRQYLCQSVTHNRCGLHKGQAGSIPYNLTIRVFYTPNPDFQRLFVFFFECRKTKRIIFDSNAWNSKLVQKKTGLSSVLTHPCQRENFQRFSWNQFWIA